MRHTLIPIAEKKVLHHEYHIRLLIVCLFALSVAGIIAVISLFPAFMYASVEEVSALRSADSVAHQKKDGSITRLKEELSTANTLTAGLSANLKQSSLADAISTIVALRGDSSIYSIVASHIDPNIVLTVEGISPTRTSLLAFKDKIQSTVSGAVVDFPYDELTQVKQVKFNFKITLSAL